jgi:hypothetical protein
MLLQPNTLTLYMRFLIIFTLIILQGCALTTVSPTIQYWMTDLCPGQRAEDPQYCKGEKWTYDYTQLPY